MKLELAKFQKTREDHPFHILRRGCRHGVEMGAVVEKNLILMMRNLYLSGSDFVTPDGKQDI